MKNKPGSLILDDEISSDYLDLLTNDGASGLKPAIKSFSFAL